MRIGRLLGSLALLCFAIGAARAQTATLYFMPWDIATRSSMTAERLRELRPVRVEVREPGTVRALRDLLRSGPDDAPPEQEPADLRLVADFVSADGTIETFVADRFRVLDTRTRRTRKIDGAFRHDLAVTLLR